MNNPYDIWTSGFWYAYTNVQEIGLNAGECKRC